MRPGLQPRNVPTGSFGSSSTYPWACVNVPARRTFSGSFRRVSDSIVPLLAADSIAAANHRSTNSHVAGQEGIMFAAFEAGRRFRLAKLAAEGRIPVNQSPAGNLSSIHFGSSRRRYPVRGLTMMLFSSRLFEVSSHVSRGFHPFHVICDLRGYVAGTVGFGLGARQPGWV